MEETTTVIFKPSRTVPPMGRNARLSFDGLTLRAGPKNFLGPADIAKLTKHPDFARYAVLGAIEIVESGAAIAAVPGKPAYPEKLDKLNVEQAEDMINACDELEVLRRWLGVETRKGLREILNRRIAEVQRS
ncbi:MAG TPA: hypothetical protein V6D06_14395 [Trichocoleus sp.]